MLLQSIPRCIAQVYIENAACIVHPAVNPSRPRGEWLRYLDELRNIINFVSRRGMKINHDEMR